MSLGISSVKNLKESSQSNSPFLHYATYENQNILTNNNQNSRFKKVPVVKVEQADDMDNLNELKSDQLIPLRKRFEVEKVEENTSLLANIENIETTLEIDNNHNNADTYNSQRSDHSKKSVLKKTMTKFDYDESLLGKEAKIPKQPEINDDEDEEEDDETPTCIRVNYNKRNEARSITVNCGSPTANTYMSCFNDIKSLSFYKKLIAEYLGMLGGKRYIKILLILIFI
jgi:hypothetical protein